MSAADGEHEETFQEKAIRKFGKEPLVPIFCLATVGFLAVGVGSFLRGKDKRFQQNMMRGRVLAQGAAVLAMCGGAAYQGGRVKREDLETRTNGAFNEVNETPNKWAPQSTPTDKA